MNFYDKDEYTYGDIQFLIDNEVEENIYLDYKAEQALCPDKIDEITKDVSAFANSDGGIIVYGVGEDKKTHTPLPPHVISNDKVTKEWLEQKICLIQPRIDGIRIYPIHHPKEKGYLYLVKIPRSDRAPHMAKDGKFYKRLNFSCEPMAHYEVKDLFYRHSFARLEILGCAFAPLVNQRTGNEELCFQVFVQNNGKACSKSYKINLYFYTSVLAENFALDPFEQDKGMLFSKMDNHSFKITLHSKEDIYYNECISFGGYLDTEPINKEIVLSDLLIRVVLFYENGKDELLYVVKEDKKIKELTRIEEILKNRYPDYHMDWL